MNKFLDNQEELEKLEEEKKQIEPGKVDLEEENLRLKNKIEQMQKEKNELDVMNQKKQMVKGLQNEEYLFEALKNLSLPDFKDSLENVKKIIDKEVERQVMERFKQGNMIPRAANSKFDDNSYYTYSQLVSMDRYEIAANYDKYIASMERLGLQSGPKQNKNKRRYK